VNVKCFANSGHKGVRGRGVEGAIDLTRLKLLSAARRKEIMARIHRDGALLLLCLMLGSTPLHAWNNEGHMVTAFIAYSSLPVQRGSSSPSVFNLWRYQVTAELFLSSINRKLVAL
jgi:hypothetical protein